MYLYAATFSPNTLAPKTVALGSMAQAITQFTALEKAVRDVRAAVDSDLLKRAKKREPYLIVLLAPEYFFARDPAQCKRFISQDIKKYVVEQLRSLSSQRLDMLIVPGTVPWQRPAYQGDTTKDTARVQRALGRIQTAKGYNLRDDNYLGLRGWSYSGPGHDTYQLYDDPFGGPNKTIWPNPYSVGDPKLGKDERWLQKPGKNVYIAQNTAYIAYGGQILKYHKIGSFQEVRGENEHRVVYSPGNQVGQFSVGGLTCGLEICRDHALGVMTYSSSPVDVQLIVSASISNIPTMFNLNNGGVVVHADSTQGTSPGVERVVVTGTSVIELPSPLSSGLLSVARVYMPAVLPSGNLKGQKLTSTSLASK
jgi:predicted amidohydrolase